MFLELVVRKFKRQPTEGSSFARSKQPAAQRLSLRFAGATEGFGASSADAAARVRDFSPRTVFVLPQSLSLFFGLSFTNVFAYINKIHLWVSSVIYYLVCLGIPIGYR